MSELSAWYRSTYGLQAEDRVSWSASPAFDATILEIWPALSSGATLYLVPDELRGSAPELACWLVEKQIAIAFLPTAISEGLLALPWSTATTLRALVTGGDRLALRPPSDLPFTLFNLYGPTEVTVVASGAAVNPVSPVSPVSPGSAVATRSTADGAPAIGRPIAGIGLWVVRQPNRPQPVAMGSAGELWVGGDHLARGYLGRPALTAASFLPDPLSGASGGRLYRTGDLVRQRQDGQLEFLGRIDSQVKIRGYRIELGEIEAVLLRQPEVGSAVVDLRRSAAGDRRLAAWLVAAAGNRDPAGEGETLDLVALAARLRQELPDYMVPAAWVEIDELPLTAHGKLDRSALPEPRWGLRDAGQHWQPPRPGIEATLAGQWAQLLGVERVGARDSFFDLGGHSLLATRLISKVRDLFGVEIPLRDLFASPTLRHQAERIEAARRTHEAGDRLPAPHPRPAGEPARLSFAQERLWFLDQLEPGGSAYNLPIAVDLRGELDGAALAASLAAVVRRHESLRTTVMEVEGVPLPRIAPPSAAPVWLPWIDLTGLGEARAGEILNSLSAIESARPFDLTAGPLFRPLGLRLSPARHRLMLSTHHIVSDGWSMGVLVDEVTQGYAARLAGREVPLARLPIQYSDYAAWQRGATVERRLESHLAYWHERLDGVGQLELVTDRPRQPLARRPGAQVDHRLSPELTAAVDRLAVTSGATPFMVLLAALGEVLSRRAVEGGSVLIGTPVANREQTEIEPLIGLFVNTLVLHLELAGEATVEELIVQARDTALDGYAHQALPFERLVEALGVERTTDRSPLFQVMLAFQNAPRRAIALPGLSAEVVESPSTASKFDLTVVAFHDGEGAARTLRLGGEYNRDLFDRTTISRLLRQLESFLVQAVAAPQRRLRDLSLLSRAEGHQVAVEWSAAAQGRARGEAESEVVSLWSRVAQQTRRTPDAVALATPDGVQLSYGELVRRAERLAAKLARQGVGAEDRVGLYFERSWPLVVAMLATAASGAAYVPLSPAQPGRRLAAILRDSRPAVVLAEADLAPELEAELPGGQLMVLDAAALLASGDNGGSRRPTGPPSPLNVAYLLFTSGSTGEPKGAAISHGAAVNHMDWMVEAFAFSPATRVVQKTPISFDASVWEFWAPLIAGCRLELAPLGWEEDPALLSSMIEQRAITDLQVVPSLLELLLHEESFAGLASLRRLFCGGEALSGELRDRVQARLDADLVNLYGPTEATIDSLFHRCPSPDSVAGAPVGGVPIGRPITGAAVRVIDEEGRWAAVGSLGELCVAGRGLGRGYFGRPRWSAEAFVPDLAAGQPGGRMYRTGDLVRTLADGRVSFQGRRDFQVKIRGYRIEPGEIEAALVTHPGVESVAVVPRRDLPGGEGLVAYWVANSAGQTAEASALRAHLSERLPPYMVPVAFVELAALPVTSAGKLDRRALPRPAVDDLAGQGVVVAPRTATERAVERVWCEVLGIEPPGVESNFFDLGGHSLLATRVVSRLRSQFAIDLPLKRLFQRPTVAGLAAFVDAELQQGSDRKTASVPPVEPRDRRADLALPLSYSQERLWFLQQLEPESPAYNMPAALRLRGELRCEVLARRLGEVVRRHEALRTRLLSVDGVGRQRIDPPPAGGRLALPLLDLTRLGAGAESTLARLARIEAQRPFDLAARPPIRAALARLAAGEHVLLLDLHHAAFDGWSKGILVGEVQALYTAFAVGAESPLPELPVQYADYTLWQRAWLGEGEMERQLGYWRAQLAGANTQLELPTDRPRPRHPSYRAGHLGLRLPAALMADFEALCRRRGITQFMAFLALHGALLARWSGQSELTVGSPIANRSRPEIEGLIGFFVNTLVLRFDLSEEPSFAALLAQTERTALDAYAHQDLPFERLVEELEPEREANRTPLFQSMLVLQNAPAQPVRLPGLVLEALPTASVVAKFDLLLTLAPEVGERAGWTGEFEYSRDLFDATTMQRLAEGWQRLLAAALANPELPLGRHELLSPGQRHQLLCSFNDTAVDPAEAPFAVPVHLRFQAVAVENPDRVAVAGEGWSLSYGALDRRAGQLAAALRQRGVGTDCRVALGLARSPAMVEAVLAVHKAGAAYMPLDPTLPRERLAFMVDNASVDLLLSDRATVDQLPTAGLQLLLLDTDADPWAALEPFAGRDSRPASLASLLYTSGSTGRPKGVAMSHGALANMVEWQLAASSAGPETRTLQFAALSFDVSFQELYATWCSAGTLQLIEESLRRDARALLSYLDRHRIERIFLPFVALQQLAEVAAESGCYPAALREVVTAGEQLVVHGPVAAFFDRLPSAQRTLANQYGPTEAHVVSEQLLVGAATGWPALPAIGRPIRATRLLVLDGGGLPAPLGVAGELFIAGAALARGYLGQPALTAASFLPDPWGEGGRCYRTGDLARLLPSGAIEYLGRRDGQTKVRGHRVELGEVEAVLAEYPGMHQAAVAVHPDAGGRNSLVGYVVMDGELDLPELRTFLSDRLPGYMVPALFVELAELPLTASGKLARRALPAPDRSRAGADFSPPETEVEKRVAAIWRELLGVGRIGREDDFFALGGHSLLATQAVSRVNQTFKVEVPLATVFDHPTLTALSQWIEEFVSPSVIASLPPLVSEPLSVPPEPVASQTPPAPVIPETAGVHGGGESEAVSLEPSEQHKQEVAEAKPRQVLLSFAQERLWFLEQLAPGSGMYNVPAALEITGAVDVNSLARALADVRRRHESLRTTFVDLEGIAYQRIAPATTVRAHLPVIDICGLKATARRALTLRLATLEARQPFDLRRGPLLRAALIVATAWSTTLLLNMHHIVSDGWSMAILVDELRGYYGARAQGRPFVPPPLQVQYPDFALRQRAWLEGGELERQLEYWREHLQGAPGLLELPTDRPRPPVRTTRGGVTIHRWPRELQAELTRLSQASGCTLFMALLAGFSLVLSRYSGQGDIVVGTPIANRTERDLEPLIGFFVNTLALRIEVARASCFEELLDLVRQTALGGYGHQDVPFERLVHELVDTRAMDRTPLFQVSLMLQNVPSSSVNIPGLTMTPLETQGLNAKFDLTLELSEQADGLRVAAEYNRDLFDTTTIERLLHHMRRGLAGGAAAPERPLAALQLWSAGERQQVTVEWNDTALATQGHAHGDLWSLVAAQAARTPHAVALVSGDRYLSYSALLAWAEALAVELHHRGVGPWERVGVRLARGPELVVSLLAVLRAGGAYVAIDPAYPVDRQELMLADSGARLLLTDEAWLDGQAAMAIEHLSPGGPRSLTADELRTNPLVDFSASGLAYLIYTSGSTGRPKGVAIGHASAVALVRWASTVFSASELRGVLAATSFCFDLSIFELFLPLSCGGTVLLVDDALELASMANSSAVTLINTVPSVFKVLLTLDAIPAGVATINLAGEPLDDSLAVEIYCRTEARLLNLYGPSEDTTYSTWAQGDRASLLAPPIGRPVGGTRGYLLAPGGVGALGAGGAVLQPLGSRGELYLAGDGLALGYLDRPRETAERFLPDPFGKLSGGRLYRTGDLARYRADGTLSFLGRADYQVKLRGFRIELGEIEARMLAHPTVREAAVLVKADDLGEERLVGYVVFGATLDVAGTESTEAVADDKDALAELRSHLASSLPAYMIPSLFVTLERLPLTANGKLDRKALPEPDRSQAAARFSAPASVVEQTIATIWKDILAVEQVGRDDDFFLLGGHSLLATQVLARVRKAYGVDLSVLSFFEAPTVAAMARKIHQAEDSPAAKSIALASRDEGDLPLSFAQERLWFLDQLTPGSAAYNIPSALEVTGEVTVAALAGALTDVCRRHESLRTTFVQTDGQPRQRIAAPEQVKSSLPVIDLRRLALPAARGWAGRLAGLEGLSPSIWSTAR